MEKEISINCEVCGVKFCGKAVLMRHFTAIHTGIKSYTCDVCQGVYPSEYRLKVHYNLHSKEIEFRCNLCEKVFYLRSSLMTHMEQAHLKSDKEHRCDVCDKTYASHIH